MSAVMSFNPVRSPAKSFGPETSKCMLRNPVVPLPPRQMFIGFSAVPPQVVGVAAGSRMPSYTSGTTASVLVIDWLAPRICARPQAIGSGQSAAGLAVVGSGQSLGVSVTGAVPLLLKV